MTRIAAIIQILCLMAGLGLILREKPPCWCSSISGHCSSRPEAQVGRTQTALTNSESPDLTNTSLQTYYSISKQQPWPFQNSVGG